MLNDNVILPLTSSALRTLPAFQHLQHQESQQERSLPLLQSVEDNEGSLGLEGGIGGQDGMNPHIQIMRRVPDPRSGIAPALPLQIITLCWHPDTCPNETDKDDEEEEEGGESTGMDLTQVHQHWSVYLQDLMKKEKEQLS